jgi:hypothetical protein
VRPISDSDSGRETEASVARRRACEFCHNGRPKKRPLWKPL